MIYRILNSNDTIIYKDLRLFSVRESPFAFSDSYEDELNKSYFDYELELGITGFQEQSFILGVFSDTQELIGFVKLKRDNRTKAVHKASLHTLYVKPQFRKLGIGKKLMFELLKKSGELAGLEQIHLWALISDTSVVQFYEKFGFESQGTIVKNDLKIDGKYVNALYMVKYLKK